MPCTGPAGGVLTGTYPNPGLADDVVGLNNLTDVAKPALNLLSNPGFNFAQLHDPTVYTALNDNDVAADCWKCTFENSGVSYKRILNDNTYNSANRGSFKKTGSAGKMMIYQPLETLISLGMTGHASTWNLQLNMSTGYNMRLALLQYNNSGSLPVDNLTSPISAWNAVSVLPTLTADWSYVAQFQFAAGAGRSEWAIFAGVPFSAYTNLAVAIFSDDQIAANDVIEMAECGYYNGFSGRFVWNPLVPNEDMSRVERFIEKSYDPDVLPGTVTTIGQLNNTQASSAHVEPVLFKQRKVKTPIVTLYNPNSGASGSWRDIDAVADVTMVANDIGTGGFGAKASSGGTNGNRLTGHVLLNSSL